MTRLLWIVQSLLALAFVFAGSMKLIMPLDVLAAQIPLPGLFMRYVGVAELLGGLGLILPSLLKIRPSLTPLAAIELVHVMLAAALLTLATTDNASLALIPLVIAGLCGFVAYGRWRLAPLSARRATTPRHALQSSA